MDLLDRFAGIESRYEELNRRIAEPSAMADREKFAQLAREHAEARELVEAFRAYAGLRRRIAEAEELLSDPELGEVAREELDDARARYEAVEAELRELLAPTDPLDAKNAILEIRAGTGGDEAALFAADLYRMYGRYAEQRGWAVEELSANVTGIGGVKEIIALVKGKRVYGRLKYESGAHRVQRVPVTEAGGRIHTSAVTVAILPEADDIDVEVAPEDLRIDVFRAGGAGGQHVNKTESAVRVTHLPTGVVVSCQDEKSQHKNRAKAMKILKSRLFEQMSRDAESKRSSERRSLVGSGDRSERIRTYNFPQGRVTDHRINLTIYRLEAVLGGDLDPLLDPLHAHAQAEALAGPAE